MSKKILSILMTMIMLFSVMLPVLSYTATTPTITVKSGNTILSTSKENVLNSGDKITISASPNIEYIKYQVGTGNVVTVNASSATVTVPDNMKGFSLQVYARTTDNMVAGWYTYKISVPDANTDSSVPTITVKSGNTTFANNGTYNITAGDKITISASPNIDYMKYKVGTAEVVTVNSSSVTLTVPTDLTEYSLQVFARTTDGIASGDEYNYYTVKVNSDSAVPTITVKSGTTTFANNGTYNVNAGDKITINATPNIEYIKYKVGTADVVTVNSSSVTLTVPSNLTEYSLQVYARGEGGTIGWNLYNIVVDDANTDSTVPTITVKSGNTTFKNNGTYNVNAGDKITINATPNIEYIKYKVGTADVVTVNSSSVTLTVPSDLTEYSLQVFTRGEGGTLGWNLYNIVVDDSDSTVPTITVKSGDTTFKNNGTYNVEAGDKIVITAEPNIEYIKYKIGTSDVVTVNSSKVTLTVPDDYAKYSLQVFARGEDGTAGWNLYNLVIDDINNYDYPIEIQPDERLNSDIDGLYISLRTIPLTEKEGNQNYFEIDEKIQYNIDFANGGKSIDGKVNIYFTIPSNVEAEFIDINGGTQIDEYTIRWTFDGLSKGEKGTIPVVLRYVDMDGNSQIVKPYAKIASSTKEDMSAVINFIYSDESAKINTEHKPFMIGDGDKNTFRPSEGLNRAEMAMILTRIFNIPLVSYNTVTYRDADYISQRYGWAEQAIMTVTKYGLMEGYENGEFRPAEKVTYAQLITVLARQLEIDNNTSGLNPFEIKDEPIKLFKDLSRVYSSYGYSNHWATEYLAQMVRLNMLPEFKNTYDGDVDEIIARSEVAKLISLVLLRGPSEDGTSNDSLTSDFDDVTTRTRNYEYILEASAPKHNSKFTSDGIEIMYK